jgi:hypothetical protein
VNPKDAEEDLQIAVDTITTMLSAGIPVEKAFPDMLKSIKRRFESTPGFTTEDALDWVITMNLHACLQLARVEIAKRN